MQGEEDWDQELESSEPMQMQGVPPDVLPVYRK